MSREAAPSQPSDQRWPRVVREQYTRVTSPGVKGGRMSLLPPSQSTQQSRPRTSVGYRHQHLPISSPAGTTTLALGGRFPGGEAPAFAEPLGPVEPRPRARRGRRHRSWCMSRPGLIAAPQAQLPALKCEQSRRVAPPGPTGEAAAGLPGIRSPLAHNYRRPGRHPHQRPRGYSVSPNTSGPAGAAPSRKAGRGSRSTSPG